MSYSVAKLTAVAECDALLTIAGKDKSSLEFRRTTLLYQMTNMSEAGTEVSVELTTVNAEIASYQASLLTLPESRAKEETKERLKRNELRLMTLVRKDRNYGVISQLVRESDIARIEKEITELEVLIAAVTTRKAAL